MDVRRLVALVIGLAVAPAARSDEKPDKGQAPGPLPIEARLLVPLGGTKTTLRLEVKSIRKHAAVFPPFVNATTLVVTTPDGKTLNYGRCEENRPPDGLGKGETRSWDVDLADHIKFTQPGKYTIAFEVGLVRSNEVLLAVDTETRARERAEGLLKVLRAKQWDKAAPYVIVSAGKHDAETRRRMGIAKDASPEEVAAKVGVWFKALYERGAKVGAIQDVKPDDRDKDFVLVSYRHEDLDAFAMRRVGDEWYYTLDGRPQR